MSAIFAWGLFAIISSISLSEDMSALKITRIRCLFEPLFYLIPAEATPPPPREAGSACDCIPNSMRDISNPYSGSPLTEEPLKWRG